MKNDLSTVGLNEGRGMKYSRYWEKIKASEAVAAQLITAKDAQPKR
jgi:hypothetical protein